MTVEEYFEKINARDEALQTYPKFKIITASDKRFKRFSDKELTAIEAYESLEVNELFSRIVVCKKFGINPKTFEKHFEKWGRERNLELIMTTKGFILKNT